MGWNYKVGEFVYGKSTMKKWNRCIRKATVAGRLEKSLDLQKNGSKNVCEGQGAKFKKNRNVFQSDVGGQQSKYQLHCHR